MHFKATLSIPDLIRQDENAYLPEITFKLVNEDNIQIDPLRPPKFEIPSPQDIFPDEEHDLSFPLYETETNTSLFHSKMKKMKLIIKVENNESSEEFPLK